MSFDTFKKIFDRLPRNLTQLAFGADAHCKSNPDIWEMMSYCRTNGKNEVIPNIAVADIDDETELTSSEYKELESLLNEIL